MKPRGQETGTPILGQNQSRPKSVSANWDCFETPILQEILKFVHHLTQFRNASNLREWSMTWTVPIPSKVYSSNQETVFCVFRQRGSDQMIIKGRSPTMRHVARTHRVAVDVNLDPKINTLTPRTNSQTCEPKEISHVMNGIIFCVFLFNISNFRFINFFNFLLKKERRCK